MVPYDFDYYRPKSLEEALLDGDKTNIAFSGLKEVSFRSKELEEILNNRTISREKRISNILNLVDKDLLDDNNGSPEYRKFVMSKVLEEIIDKFEGREAHA